MRSGSGTTQSTPPSRISRSDPSSASRFSPWGISIFAVLTIAGLSALLLVTISLQVAAQPGATGSLDKAQALRQAMLTTLQTHPNPRDWAAFTLMGEAT
ncbi:MAG: hypothetical protein HC929_01385 [Leptolyngbyaceae cyanobacterium SM2_5_2]|nr:hypothetical protein [Leptolyngbyaceae cyanobacterium SM2_5_2]